MTQLELAEIFNVTIDQLMQVKADAKEKTDEKNASELINIILKDISLAMGVAAVVLSAVKEIGTDEAVSMMGIGLACLAIARLQQR